MKKTIFLLMLLSHYTFAFSFSSFVGDWYDDIVEKPKKILENNSLLSEKTVSKALKEALQKGVTTAITTLGKENSYLNNKEVKIPLPPKLEKSKKIISSLGGKSYINDFEKSINDAATQAVPKTAKIFANAISKMSIKDATNILKGNDDSATKYFKSNTLDSLKELIKPIVKESIASNKVSKYYSSLNNFYNKNMNKYVKSESVMSYAKSFGVKKYIPKSDDKNLDDYIVSKTLDGLFIMIAKEEKAIRDNPKKRTTELLKKVFN